MLESLIHSQIETVGYGSAMTATTLPGTLPAGFSNAGAMLVGGSARVIGGMQSLPSLSYRNQSFLLDLTTGNVSSTVSLPSTMAWINQIGVSGSTAYVPDYVVGGSGPSSTLITVNGTTGAAATKNSPAITAVHGSGVCMLDSNRLFKAGGDDSAAMTSKKCAIYNISGNSWTTVADAPHDMNGTSAHFYNGLVYLTRGFSKSDLNRTETNSFFIYDPAVNRWSTGPEFPETIKNCVRAWDSSILIGSDIWFFGRDRTGVISASDKLLVVKYNIVLGNYTIFTTSEQLRHCAALVYTSSTKKIHLIGGAASDPMTAGFGTNATTRYSNTIAFTIP